MHKIKRLTNCWPARLALCALLIAALAVTASAGEQINYKCSIVFHPELLFPRGMKPNQVSADYFKRHYHDKLFGANIRKLMAMNSRPPRVTSELTETLSGNDYSIQLLGMSLPSKAAEIRHEVFQDGFTSNWFTYGKQKIFDTGHVSQGWTESLTFAPVVHSLLQYVPVGDAYSKPGLGPNEVAYLETRIEKVGERGGTQPVDGRRYFVIEYVDRARQAIRQISCYWNSRARQPYYVMSFKGSKVVGNRNQFREMTIITYDGDRIESKQQFTTLSVNPLIGQVEANIPKGTEFVDRRVGQNKTFTFNYDGTRFPTVSEELAIMNYGKSVTQGERNSGLLQLLGGISLGIFGFGLGLWIRARSTAPSPHA